VTKVKKTQAKNFQNQKRETEGKKNKKRKIDKQKNLQQMFDQMVSENERPQEETSTDKTQMAPQTSIEQQLKEINEKLGHVVRKDDKSFLRELVKEIFIEIKDTLMASLTLRIEVLEGDVHDKATENQALKEEINSLKRQVEPKDSELHVENMKIQHEKVQMNISEKLNEQEQYSRKNSIRITTLAEDYPEETALETAEKVVKNLNHHLKLNLSKNDIDIAHRLGKHKPEKRGRAVIVKFIQKTTKQNVLAKRKLLKGKGVAVYEDLTRLNSEVLACTRKKLPDEVNDSWSVNGNIFVKWKANEKIDRLKFEEFQRWLDLPWPETTPSEGRRG